MSYLKTLAEAKQLLAERQPFTTGTLRAEWQHIDWQNNNPVYVVLSYDTPIAKLYPDTGEAWTTPNKYSVTTSKHLNIVKRAWEVI